MHPYVEEVLDQLDRSRASLRAAIEEVPVSLRGVKPAEDRWSVAQVVEHLWLAAQIREIARQLNARPTRPTGEAHPA